MVKYVFCVRRPASMSQEEFQDYWLYKHAPLLKQYAEVLRIKRYAQVHRLNTPVNDQLRQSRGTGEPFDGVGEIWWESIGDMLEASASSEGQEASRLLQEDSRNFIDFARSTLFLAEEHVIL